jgi:MOSC domain-containing protein YiiM
VKVDSVHRDDKHRFSKPAVPEVRLIEGIAVAGDAHAGATVQHLHLVRRNAAAPNLRLGDSAAVTVTGLRDPCNQINKLRKGMLKEVLWREADGTTVYRVGIMAVVSTAGVVRPGDPLTVVLPPDPHEPLGLV